MILEPKCKMRGCIHFIGVSQPNGTETTERVVCKAFPRGIPNQIAYGNNLHLKKYKGQDNSIIFESGE